MSEKRPARLNATLDLDAGGLVTALHCYAEYPSPVGLTPEAWFASERAAGREWRVDSDGPQPAYSGPTTRVLAISRPC